MVSINEDSVDESGRGIERRTILKAAAWTVPTIVIASASPAAAAASGTMAATSATGDQNGTSKNVDFTVTFAGTSAGAHTVTYNSVTGGAGPWSIGDTTGTIPDGGGQDTFRATSAGNPAGASVTISYTVTGHGSGTISATVSS